MLFAPIWGDPGLPQYLRICSYFRSPLACPRSFRSIPRPMPIRDWFFQPNFLIGLLLAMGIRIAFAGLHMGGQLLSYHLGFSAVQAIDPQTQNRSTLMSELPDDAWLLSHSGVRPASHDVSGAGGQLQGISDRRFDLHEPVVRSL